MWCLGLTLDTPTSSSGKHIWHEQNAKTASSGAAPQHPGDVQVITGKATFPPEIPRSPFGEEPEAVWHEGSNCVALNDTKTTYSVFPDPKVFLKE